ncbi:unnamed protein product [Blepharisma stoltei]|uniref:Uncharacterized protein n=1 Tax=Blepharisma stoltei TaxID=1481888 RepID=A0AAU9K9B5_9CILI|nr:unnamed protein product [Blepharisma stoltei]
MVYSKPLNTLVVLALLSFANGFDFLGDWSLTKSTGDIISRFINSQSGSDPYLSADSNIDLSSYVSCSSMSLSGDQTWSLTTDGSSLVNPTGHAVGFWVNFESTISTKVFQFGISGGPHYIVSSTENGILKASFVSASETTDSANDVFITVHLSKWLFIAFNFANVNPNPVQFEVVWIGYDVISINSGSSVVAFDMPNGEFFFGSSIKGKFHRVILTISASINSSFDNIGLFDGSSYISIAVPCNRGTCIDSVCAQSFGSLTGKICLSSLQYCTACDTNGCTTCDPDSAREEAQYCLDCKDSGDGNVLRNYHCCALDNNCAECSKISTQCDACEAGYFLNDDSPTSTSCIYCTDSCTYCEPGPECYTCATAITQTGTTCREDSVGFQVSLDVPNIVLDFAHQLSTGLSKSSFKATLNSGADISTSGWTFTGCVAGVKQCKIEAPNIQESDLPIAIDFEFAEV